MRVFCYTTDMSIEQTSESGPSTPSLERYKSQILTPEEYVRHPWVRAEAKGSYSYTLSNGLKTLTMFGSEHIHDPEHSLFTEIDEAFETARPDLVLVEGMEGIENNVEAVRARLRGMTVEDAKHMGENMYTLKRAVDAEIAFESPEPSHEKEIQHLLSLNFPKEFIYGQTVYRSVVEFQRRHPSTKSMTAFLEFLHPYRSRFQQDSGWDQEEIDAIEKALLQSIDLSDTEAYTRKIDPMPWDGKYESTMNSLGGASTLYRDRHILDRIADGLRTHDRVFVVYGSGHAVSLEPALRALMDDTPPQDDQT